MKSFSWKRLTWFYSSCSFSCVDAMVCDSCLYRVYFRFDVKKYRSFLMMFIIQIFLNF